MGILKKATNQTAYLKAGILGFAGSGKTFTASNIALGLSKDIGDGKPVAFFDTETGSDYLIPVFEEAGVELLVAKTRSFKDIVEFMKEAEQQCSVAIIDSITHVWQELIESYTRRLRRKHGLQFQDWGTVKSEWRQFTDLFLNSQLHVILCGRAGYEYDFQDNEGKKELVKTGTKMKAESEMGYEPSLLLEMARMSASEVTGDVHQRGWVHRCYVLKDRTNRINGACFDNPTYDHFGPVVNFLNVGGSHVGVDTSRNSEEMFDSPDWSYAERKRQVDIALEEIKDLFVEADLASNGAEAKKLRIQFLKEAFHTSSWTAITGMSLEEIRLGKERISLRIRALSEDVGADPEHNQQWGLAPQAEEPA